MSIRWFLVLAAGLASLTCMLFVAGLPGAFIFDDGPNIVHNGAVQITELTPASLRQAAYSFQPGGGSRALAMLSFGLDHWRAGLDPTAFKITNLVIHALTTVALSVLFRSLLLVAGWPPQRAWGAALALASAWAVHPLQVSSVLYVVQRMQTLATLSLVLAMLAYVLARQAQISGRPSRNYWILTLLCGCLAFASKEDSIALPGYLLALELTVLRFRAAQPSTARTLHRTWIGLAAAGIALYAFVALPHFWEAGVYAGRDYGSMERLFTQARVLVMYLGQILAPLPQHLPFYYDWVVPSRGLLQPWTTLPAIGLLLALLGLAWWARERRPVFSLGLLLFFAGHFITSNVIGLELAFEHRNHFPLIGIVLAVGDLVAWALARADTLRSVVLAACVLPLLALSGMTVIRAGIWGDPAELAQRSTEFAAGSARAWNSLCLLNYDLSGRRPGPYLDRAIDACEQGARREHAVTALTNLLVFKTLRGDAGPKDWQRFHTRLRTMTMTPENSRALWVILNRAREEAPLDEDGVLEAIDIITARVQLRPVEYAAIGYYILGRTSRPDLAYRHFALAVEHSPPGSAFAAELIEDMRKQNRYDWGDRLEAQAASKGKPDAPR